MAYSSREVLNLELASESSRGLENILGIPQSFYIKYGLRICLSKQKLILVVWGPRPQLGMENRICVLANLLPQVILGMGIENHSKAYTHITLAWLTLVYL